MIKTKSNRVKNPYLVEKLSVSITGTLKNLPYGRPIKFNCIEFTTLSSIRGTIIRLNKQSGFEEFTVFSNDNGATYEVTRHRRKSATERETYTISSTDKQ